MSIEEYVRRGADEDNFGYWEGLVFSVRRVATGESRYGPWELYIITGFDGSEFSTFSAEEAALAGLGYPVLIDWEIGKKGTKTATMIQLAKEST